MKNQKPVPLPIHFKLPGRSYSQIGRKGNVALYSVYSDYFSLPNYALPYVLIGFELIVVKVKDGREVYPSAWQFGSLAWSIPKSLTRVCVACTRCCRFLRSQLGLSKSETVPDRSPAPKAFPPLASAPI